MPLCRHCVIGLLATAKLPLLAPRMEIGLVGSPVLCPRGEAEYDAALPLPWAPGGVTGGATLF